MRCRDANHTPLRPQGGSPERAGGLPVTLILTVFVLSPFCASCFDLLGDGPIFPTGGPTASMPTASLMADGELVSITPGCVAKCAFRGRVRNRGFGCASRVHGTTTLLDAAGNELAAFDWSLDADLVVRPEQTADYLVTSVPKEVADSFATSAGNILWTTVRC